ncbi:MAG: hypothetical protein KAT77_00200 [Nanoarchaeota archaeon]|nr:hypothetical protein [Nanoarchaeota archaeon]
MRKIILFTLILILTASFVLAQDTLLEWEDLIINFDTLEINNGEIITQPLSPTQVDANNLVTLQFQIAFGEEAIGEVVFLDKNGEFARQSISISPQETGESTGKVTFQLPDTPGTYFIAVKLGEGLGFDTFYYHIIEEPAAGPGGTGEIPPIVIGDGDTFDPGDIPPNIPDDTPVQIINPDGGSTHTYTKIDDFPTISSGDRKKPPTIVVTPEEIGYLILKKYQGSLVIIDPVLFPVQGGVDFRTILEDQIDSTIRFYGTISVTLPSKYFKEEDISSATATGEKTPPDMGEMGWVDELKSVWNWLTGKKPPTPKPTGGQCCCGAGAAHATIVDCSPDHKDCGECCLASGSTNPLPMSQCTSE